MTEEWGLYLKAAQGSQGRRQGSETIVRQVKVSDQEQLLQMAKYRQILRRGTRYPARPGRQLSAVVHQAFARCAPHRPWGTPAEDRSEQLGSIPHHPWQYMLQIKDTGETKVLGLGWPVAGQVHGAGMNTDTSGKRAWGARSWFGGSKGGRQRHDKNNVLGRPIRNDYRGKTESGVCQKSLRAIQRLGVGVCPRERSIDEPRKKCPEGHVRWTAKRGTVGVLAAAWGADTDAARS